MEESLVGIKNTPDRDYKCFSGKWCPKCDIIVPDTTTKCIEAEVCSGCLKTINAQLKVMNEHGTYLVKKEK